MDLKMVICVDEKDREVGIAEKMEAHKKGLLHRVVSVIIFNSKGEMLLQQRSEGKYHSADLWTNTCCSHPAPGETALDAAHRRLKEELGLQSDLKFLFAFHYRSPFENGLTENEIDHVFMGITDQLPELNIEEAKNHKYISIGELKIDLERNPANYTVWFRILVELLEKERIIKHRA